MSPGPIETRYHGARFRSRLEARWAVFFDYFGLAWQYEKEGFDLGDGLRYLPDFWIPSESGEAFWVEIKPEALSPAEEEKLARLAEVSGLSVFAFCGEAWHTARVYLFRHYRFACPETPHISWGRFREHRMIEEEVAWSKGRAAVVLTSGRWVRSVSCEETGRSADLDFLMGEKFVHSHVPQMLSAFRAARSARFEFGESG